MFRLLFLCSVCSVAQSAWTPESNDYIYKELSESTCAATYPQNFDLNDLPAGTTASDSMHWCATAYNQVFPSLPVPTVELVDALSIPTQCSFVSPSKLLSCNQRHTALQCGTGVASNYTCLCVIKKYIAVLEGTCADVENYEVIPTVEECATAFYNVREKQPSSNYPTTHTATNTAPGCSQFHLSASTSIYFNALMGVKISCKTSEPCLCRRLVPVCTCPNGVPANGTACQVNGALDCTSCNFGYPVMTNTYVDFACS